MEDKPERKKMAPYPYNVQTTTPDLQYETFDGAKFGYMFWPVQNGNNKVKGRVLLIHGFGEYTKIQFRLMDHLSLNGYESFTFDQRGAGVTSTGKSKGVTDEYHVFNDLEHFVERNLRECKAKGIPLFMWGHSMGGGICLNYACQGKHKNEISGYIGSGPLIILHPHTMYNKATEIMAPLLARFLPRVRIDTGLDLNGITSDKTYRDFLGSDPMSIPLYGSFRQMHDFMQRGAKLYKNEDNYIQKNFAKNKPVIIMHGQDDTINDPKGSEKFIQDCPSKDKELKLYPNARHSIFSLETDKVFNIAFDDMKQWLDRHIATEAKP